MKVFICNDFHACLRDNSKINNSSLNNSSTWRDLEQVLKSSVIIKINICWTLLTNKSAKINQLVMCTVGQFRLPLNMNDQ